MGAVRAATLLGCLVDLDMLNDEGVSVEAFGVGIGFSVLQQAEEKFGRFDWPSGA
jgi:hypothetical protein